MLQFILKLLRFFGLWPKENDEVLAKKCIAKFDSVVESIEGRYITHREHQTIKMFLSDPYRQVKKLHFPKRHSSYQQLQHFISWYAQLDEVVVKHNKEYIANELDRCNSLFSDIDGKALDPQQRNVVVMDEDRNLVLAGAGSGKTLTIAGKVKYLCQEKSIAPEEILLISFTKKAARDMSEKVNKIGIPIQATNFHKLGLSIISKHNGSTPNVEDNATKFIKNYFENNVLTNPMLIKLLIEYFAYYLHIPANLEDFNSLGEMYEHEKGMDLETLNSKYKQKKFIQEAALSQASDHVSLKKERLKSSEEVIIANFLFLHGVEYEYEPLYPFKAADGTKKPYRPDFYLPEYKIYLEHFGINKENRTPWLSEIEEQKYLDGIQWKRSFHREHGTKLIETYSYYSSEGHLQEKLEELLLQNGVKFKEPDFLDIFNTIYSGKGDKYFSEFIDLCCTFITLFKSNGYEIHEIDRLTHHDKIYKTPFFMQRTYLFKSIIKPIMAAYNAHLQEQNSVDFSDMINHAAKIVAGSKHKLHPYKWVIIDEYQDISVARFRLIDAILKNTGAKLLCVGDDWQSIYRFAGSDLALFTKFSEYFGYSEIMRIEQTYRNSQQLIDVAGSFVMENPFQMKKSLRSSKKLTQPISFMCYAYSPDKRLKESVQSCIDNFGAESTIMLLGRTKHDLELVKRCDDFDVESEDKIVFKDSPSTPIFFMNVHKSKGLEADNVILLNFQNAVLGFPNKIANDPLLELVLTQSDDFEYAEERRLLYVALTRTRNRVFILVDERNASEFFKEFPASEAIFIQPARTKASLSKVNCPRCKTGKLIECKTASGSFVGCSNFPKCNYSTGVVSILTSPKYCPQCGGFLFEKKGNHGAFMGCNNYPTCKYTQPIDLH